MPGRAVYWVAPQCRILGSDSTEFSGPILERAGLVKVSTTTLYRWRR